MKKILTIGVILLFIGIVVTPTINFNTVKASVDDDLVEVTTQAYGIQGYGNTTVKLTQEQYQNLEAYLVEFRARLNQTLTREEAIPIFKDAVVKLDKYGLLPKGMSVTQAQSLFTSKKSNPFRKFVEERLHVCKFFTWRNIFCLLFARINQCYFYHYTYLLLLATMLHLDLLEFLLTLPALIFSGFPITISLFSINCIQGGSANIHSFGVYGKKNFEFNSDLLVLIGFIGLKIQNPINGNGYLFGWTAFIG